MKQETIAQQNHLLWQHHLLPPDWESSESAGERKSWADLAPFLLQAWMHSLGPSQSRPQRRVAEGMVAWLEKQIEQHAALTWGVPGDTFEQVQDWTGQRLVWWPRGIPQGERIAVISSRLTRTLERHRAWFAALRELCAGLDPDRTTLLAAEGTTPFPFLERCSELFQLPLLRFDLPGNRLSVARWFQSPRGAAQQPSLPSNLVWPAWVSPTLSPFRESELPLRDRMLVAAGDRLVVLGMRPGGHVEQLLRRRVRDASAATISLAVAPELIPEDLARQLPATQQRVFTCKPARDELPSAQDPEGGGDGRLALDQLSARGYLTHCTRRAPGPWPDERVEQYRDALILGRDDVDRSALATLARIVSQRRLHATGQAIRGGLPVVCFTALAIDQLRRMRTYRAHRGRWDFEPYGICIRRAWLEQRGARAVRYGDASLWDQLTDCERPFYQQRRSGKRGQIDWSIEREWRHVGSIDLADLPCDDAVLFVPTLEEARWLRPRSHWPVVVLDGRRHPADRLH